MKIFSFNGDQSTVLNFPELLGKTIISIHFSRWRDEEGNDKGGRIDIEIDDSPAPILYVSDLFVSTPKINSDPEKALDEAIAEMEKGESPKSLALIVLSMAKWAKKEREENKLLRDEIEKLKKAKAVTR